ncbi:MAG: hypothetical protein HUU37_05550 [Bdellovibrionales bacterium]|nr:hypothetical protein [Bdellovibrionales bacterium]
MLHTYDRESFRPPSLLRTAIRLVVLSGLTSAAAIFVAERVFADNTTDVIAVRATNQNNSQQAQRDNMTRCVGYATHGKPDGVCTGRGESNGCVGSVRAFKNSGKKTKCFIPLKFLCALWGHKQNSQPGWVSVGAAHLRNASKCLDLAKLSQVKNEQMVGIGDNADAQGSYSVGGDGGSSVSSGVVQDGASAFGLPEGDLFKGMQEGKSLADMISDSPYGKSLSDKDRQALRDAADNPSLNPDGMDEDFDLEGSTNPLQEAGGNLASLMNGGDGASLSELFGSGGASGDDVIGRIMGGAENGAGRGTASTGATAATDRDRRKSPLERTIFDMVSAQYRKNEPHLADISVFMKKAAREKRARDVRDSGRSPSATATEIRL